MKMKELLVFSSSFFIFKKSFYSFTEQTSIIMNKFIVLLTGALLLTASCKKEYTCVCITKVASYTSKQSSTISDTKKQAEEKCKKFEKTVEGSSVTCEIQ